MDRRSFFRRGAARAAESAARRIPSLDEPPAPDEPDGPWPVEADAGEEDYAPGDDEHGGEAPGEWDEGFVDLSRAERERYAGQLALPGWGEAGQVALRAASVLVVGAGGLGGVAAAYLAAAGVGRVGVLDRAAVRASGLPHQVIHDTAGIDVNRAESAAAALRRHNPDVLVETYPVALDAANADALVAVQDVVLDASNDPGTRELVNGACCAAGVPLVVAEVTAWRGRLMTIVPGTSACWRCAFPEPLDGAREPGDPEPGALGPAAGVLGSQQAAEALKLLTAAGDPLTDRVASVDLEAVAWTVRDVARRDACPVCGA